MDLFTMSKFAPIAIGFFGLGTGYLIWGGSALFGVPKSDSTHDQTIGIWGIWMPGFMQFLTGVYLMIGLTWFQVFTNDPGLYMAALAFTAYGVHWFAMGQRRIKGYESQADGWMAIAFLAISVLGLIIFFMAGGYGVGILFIGLTLIYLTEIPAKFASSLGLARLTGLWQLLTGIWLLYLTYATVFNTVLKQHWWM